MISKPLKLPVMAKPIILPFAKSNDRSWAAVSLSVAPEPTASSIKRMFLAGTDSLTIMVFFAFSTRSLSLLRVFCGTTIGVATLTIDITRTGKRRFFCNSFINCTSHLTVGGMNPTASILNFFIRALMGCLYFPLILLQLFQLFFKYPTAFCNKLMSSLKNPKPLLQSGHNIPLILKFL